MKSARVKVVNGLPRLVIDGKVEAPMMFYLRAEREDVEELNREQIRACAQAGMHLYTTLVKVPFMPQAGGRDMSNVKYAMRVILDNDPDALVLVRVGLSPIGIPAADYFGLSPVGPAVDEFCEKYPGDKMVWHHFPDLDPKSMVGSNPSAISIASDRWFEMAKDVLRELIEYLEGDEEFAPHVMGYHVGCGETSEWFYYGLREHGLDYCPANQDKYREFLREKYGDIRKLEEAWNIAEGSYDSFDQIGVPDDLPYQDRRKKAERTLFVQPGDQRYVDYYDFSSELMSQRMVDIAAFARGIVGPDKLLVFFYGYYYDVFDVLTGHFRLQKVLESPDIDAFTSPISYGDRNHGGIGAMMSPADSVTANGKLWIVENDIRTTNIVRQTMREMKFAPVPPVNSVWNVREVFTRELAHMLSHNLGCWYMDLLGYGWQHHPIIWEHIGKLLALYRAAQENTKALAPDVAVIVDEYAMSLATHAYAVGATLLPGMRNCFYRAGVKFGLYTSRDYEEGRVQGAKAVFYLTPFDISPERADKICRQAKQDDATVIFMHGFGKTDADTVKKLTGLDIRATDCGMQELTATTLSGAMGRDVKFMPDNSGQAANPAYYVEQNRASQPLAVYEKGMLAGRIAAARCAHDGFKAIFVGPMKLTTEAVREICRMCGVHVYSETEDAFISGNGIYLIHTNAEEGVRTVRLPEKEKLVCWTTGEVVETDELKTDGRSTASYLWINAQMYPGI